MRIGENAGKLPFLQTENAAAGKSEQKKSTVTDILSRAVEVYISAKGKSLNESADMEEDLTPAELALAANDKELADKKAKKAQAAEIEKRIQTDEGLTDEDKAKLQKQADELKRAGMTDEDKLSELHGKVDALEKLVTDGLVTDDEIDGERIVIMDELYLASKPKFNNQLDRNYYFFLNKKLTRVYPLFLTALEQYRSLQDDIHDMKGGEKRKHIREKQKELQELGTNRARVQEQFNQEKREIHQTKLQKTRLEDQIELLHSKKSEQSRNQEEDEAIIAKILVDENGEDVYVDPSDEEFAAVLSV